jgi:hypothetical protein
MDNIQNYNFYFTESTSHFKTNLLIPYRDITAVCEIHSKNINAFCWQTVGFFRAKESDNKIITLI